MVYLKFTNGAVTKLINVSNEVAQADALDNGFYMVTDENGSPEVVESTDLIKDRSDNRADLLRRVAEKLAVKNQQVKNQSTLSSKYKA